jgi:hypothetical protein
MLDCTELVTHIKKVYDASTRQDKLQISTIDNVSWFREEKSTLADRQVTASDLISVRIPLQGRKTEPVIEKGDILIHGSASVENISIGQIREKYPDSMEVMSVTYNRNRTPYSQHIRCSGS